MIRIFLLTIVLVGSMFGQAETLTNRNIIEMAQVGLSSEIILKKIATARTSFDVTAGALVELKKAGVSDDVIAAMLERNETSLPGEAEKANPEPIPSTEKPPIALTREQAVAGAKSIAFAKSSLHPSRQALEKELMKRKDFQKLDLAILRYKEHADLFVEIGYVSGSWITHRYVYRIYDRRSGAVIGAGETTSWGSLAENLARNIARSLTAARSGQSSQA